MDAASSKKGLGWRAPDGCAEPLACGVYDMLQCGSPRLALAIANGIPLVPYTMTVQGVFGSTAVDVVPDNGNLDKIVWDTLVRRIKFQVQNGNTPNGMQALTNYFFQFVSGIEARLKVIGAGGGYNPVPDYTPISNIAGKLDRPWLLTWTNGLKMDFQATVTLPFAPVTVTFTFQGVTAYWPLLADLPDHMAIKRLEVMGFVCECFHERYGCM